MTITDLDKLQAAERELRQRQRVYPRMIASGKMSTAFVARQTAIMRAIADDYRAKVEAGRPL